MVAGACPRAGIRAPMTLKLGSSGFPKGPLKAKFPRLPRVEKRSGLAPRNRSEKERRSFLLPVFLKLTVNGVVFFHKAEIAMVQIYVGLDALPPCTNDFL